jgi:hypothetical protein
MQIKVKEGKKLLWFLMASMLMQIKVKEVVITRGYRFTHTTFGNPDTPPDLQIVFFLW